MDCENKFDNSLTLGTVCMILSIILNIVWLFYHFRVTQFYGTGLLSVPKACGYIVQSDPLLSFLLLHPAEPVS